MVKKLKGTDADQPLTSVCCLKCFCALLWPSKMIYLCRTLSLFFNPWTSNFKTMASHPWFGKQSDHCFWPGAGEATYSICCLALRSSNWDTEIRLSDDLPEMRRLFLFKGHPLGLANMVRNGRDKSSGCTASSSSQHPDLLMSTGAGATGVPCGCATMECTEYFMYTGSEDLVGNGKRNSGIFHS